MVASTRLFALVCAAVAVYALPLGSHPSRADTSGVLARRETTLIARSRNGPVSVPRGGHGTHDSISSISSMSTHRTESTPPTSRDGSPEPVPPPNTPQVNVNTLPPTPQTLATALNALLPNHPPAANMASSPSSRPETSTPKPSRQMVQTIAKQLNESPTGRQRLGQLQNEGKQR